MKNELVMKQFVIARRRLLSVLEGITEEAAAIKPEGFNNTIQWHAGHILFIAEQFLFRVPGDAVQLPPGYKALFANGTRPDDWETEPPSLQQIIAELKEQEGRVKESITSRLDEGLTRPLSLTSGLNLNSIGELLTMAIYHEALHTGYIDAMKRIVSK
jgi:uncharacterized damage-inducible protein DinB